MLLCSKTPIFTFCNWRPSFEKASTFPSLRALTTKTSLIIIFFLLSGIPGLNAQEETEQLKEVQEEIKSKQAALNQQLQDAQSLEQQLKNAELEIAELSKLLVISSKLIKDNQQEQAELRQQQKTLLNQKKLQQELLGKQIRSAYMRGNHDYTKMLLNQEDAGKFERTLIYYGYLNKAREAQIVTFNELVDELLNVSEKLRKKEDELALENQKQKRQQQNLAKQQDKREQTLVQLKKTISSEASLIEQLQIYEQNLMAAIEAAARAQASQEIELTGIQSLRGQLQAPTQGRMRNLFGKRRQGQVRWKGVLFATSTGVPVTSIHHGKVLFADWIKGFGLMTVIDHGEGYMSLYGYNQALLKQVGDVVESGETIALVGQSGGQSGPALYFEIRHKGKAINPSKWFKK